MSIALFSFFGIVVGATLQYLFTRFLERRKHFEALQTQAYTDYLRGVAEAAHLMIQPQAGRERELLARIADAKTRVCLYGSEEVIRRLADFETQGGMIRTEEQRKAFAQVITAMRGNSRLKGAELEIILLGKNL